MTLTEFGKALIKLSEGKDNDKFAQATVSVECEELDTVTHRIKDISYNKETNEIIFLHN